MFSPGLAALKKPLLEDQGSVSEMAPLDYKITILTPELKAAEPLEELKELNVEEEFLKLIADEQKDVLYSNSKPINYKQLSLSATADLLKEVQDAIKLVENKQRSGLLGLNRANAWFHYLRIPAAIGAFYGYSRLNNGDGLSSAIYENTHITNSTTCGQMYPINMKSCRSGDALFATDSFNPCPCTWYPDFLEPCRSVILSTGCKDTIGAFLTVGLAYGGLYMLTSSAYQLYIRYKSPVQNFNLNEFKVNDVVLLKNILNYFELENVEGKPITEFLNAFRSLEKELKEQLKDRHVNQKNFFNFTRLFARSHIPDEKSRPEKKYDKNAIQNIHSFVMGVDPRKKSHNPKR